MQKLIFKNVNVQLPQNVKNYKENQSKLKVFDHSQNNYPIANRSAVKSLQRLDMAESNNNIVRYMSQK